MGPQRMLLLLQILPSLAAEVEPQMAQASGEIEKKLVPFGPKLSAPSFYPPKVKTRNGCCPRRMEWTDAVTASILVASPMPPGSRSLLLLRPPAAFLARPRKIVVRNNASLLINRRFLVGYSQSPDEVWSDSTRLSQPVQRSHHAILTTLGGFNLLQGVLQVSDERIHSLDRQGLHSNIKRMKRGCGGKCLTVRATWTAAGFRRANRCHPFLPIISRTFRMLIPENPPSTSNATTDTGGLPSMSVFSILMSWMIFRVEAMMFFGRPVVTATAAADFKRR